MQKNIKFKHITVYNGQWKYYRIYFAGIWLGRWAEIRKKWISIDSNYSAKEHLYRNQRLTSELLFTYPLLRWSEY